MQTQPPVKYLGHGMHNHTTLKTRRVKSRIHDNERGSATGAFTSRHEVFSKQKTLGRIVFTFCINLELF